MPRFRFTLRDLFWLTLVAAALLGWLIDRERLAAECERLEERVYSLQISLGLVTLTKEVAEDLAVEMAERRAERDGGPDAPP